MRRIIPMIVVIALAAFVAAGCGKFGKIEPPPPAGGNGDTLESITDEPFDDKVRKRDGCGDIEEIENKGNEHVESSKQVDYEENPPTSGEHWSEANRAPLDWGIYDDEKEDEQWVHNLEHGHVVVTYKGLSKKEYRKLESMVKEADYHLVLLPRKANPRDGVYMMAWDHRLYCEKPSAAALQEFRDLHMDQAPELMMRDRKKSEDE